MLVMFGFEKNFFIYVYDIFGFYIDLDVKIDICVGFFILCLFWILECNDIEELFGLIFEYG